MHLLSLHLVAHHPRRWSRSGSSIHLCPVASVSQGSMVGPAAGWHRSGFSMIFGLDPHPIGASTLLIPILIKPRVFGGPLRSVLGSSIRDCTPNLSRNQLGPSGLTVLVMVITWVGPNLGWAHALPGVLHPFLLFWWRRRSHGWIAPGWACSICSRSTPLPFHSFSWF